MLKDNLQYVTAALGKAYIAFCIPQSQNNKYKKIKNGRCWFIFRERRKTPKIQRFSFEASDLVF